MAGVLVNLTNGASFMETMSLLPVTGSAAPLGLIGRSVCLCRRLNAAG